MKPFITATLVITFVFALSACGLESAGTAVVVGKTKAQEAKQGQQTVNDVRERLEKSQQDHQEAQRKAEEQNSK
jgi:hypothetical protein